MDAIASLRSLSPSAPLAGSGSGHRRSSAHVSLSPVSSPFSKPRGPALRTSSCRVSVGKEAAAIFIDQMKSLSTDEPYSPASFSTTALSPLDGRYAQKTKELCYFFSEFGLIRFRVLVEVKWLIKLSQIPEIKEVPNFSEEAESFLERITLRFDVNDALEVKKIEKVTNHDVKAVEYFLKQKCKSCPEVAEVLEFFHFACTSEDINNLAHALSLKEALNDVLFPVMVELCEAICDMPVENAHIPMLSRTHGEWQGFKGNSLEAKDLIFTAKKLSDSAFKSEIEVNLSDAKLGDPRPCFRLKGSPFQKWCTIYKEDSVVAQTNLLYKLRKVIYSRRKFRLTIFPGNDHALIIAMLAAFLG